MVQVSRSPKLWSPNPPGQEEGFPWTLQIHTLGGGIASGRSSPSFLSTLKLLKPFQTQGAYLMGSPGHLLPPFVGFTLGKLGVLQAAHGSGNHLALERIACNLLPTTRGTLSEKR